jgi:nuclease HARBI1
MYFQQVDSSGAFSNHTVKVSAMQFEISLAFHKSCKRGKRQLKAQLFSQQSTMSLRYWSSYKERQNALSVISSHNILMAAMSIAFYTDNSVTVPLAQLAIASGEIVRFVYDPIVDTSIQWGRRMLIADISDSDAISNFRFRKEHLAAIAAKLWPKVAILVDGIYECIRVKNRYTVPFETGLLILLYRLAAPRCICPDMEKFFGMRKSHISSVLSTFVRLLAVVAWPYLTDLTLFRNRMPYYAHLVSEKSGGLVNNIWGFIDGTLRPTQRPSHFQRLLYSGHKRRHGLKFQSVVTPDGLFASMFGPICGNRHDSYMLRESNILPALEEMMPIDGVVYSLYGDPAYPQSRLLFGGFRYPHPNSPEAAWNQQLSRVREAVEWNFKEIIAQFRFLDHEPEMKVFKMPVGLYFFVATFLCNIHSVLYGNQAASYFDAETMTFDEYLDMVPN